MKLEVNKEELKNVSEKTIKSTLVTEEVIKVWKDNIEELKKIWSGEDADVFFNRIDIYLNKVELLKETSKTIGSFMLEADKNYCKADEEFVDDLKRERDKYERAENSNQ